MSHEKKFNFEIINFKEPKEDEKLRSFSLFRWLWTCSEILTTAVPNFQHFTPKTSRANHNEQGGRLEHLKTIWNIFGEMLRIFINSLLRFSWRVSEWNKVTRKYLLSSDNGAQTQYRTRNLNNWKYDSLWNLEKKS